MVIKYEWFMNGKIREKAKDIVAYAVKMGWCSAPAEFKTTTNSDILRMQLQNRLEVLHAQGLSARGRPLQPRKWNLP